jgi:hypothetical protein
MNEYGREGDFRFRVFIPDNPLELPPAVEAFSA